MDFTNRKHAISENKTEKASFHERWDRVEGYLATVNRVRTEFGAAKASLVHGFKGVRLREHFKILFLTRAIDIIGLVRNE